MNELVKTIDELYAAFKTDAELQAGKNNKAAGLRARKVSLELENTGRQTKSTKRIAGKAAQQTENQQLTAERQILARKTKCDLLGLCCDLTASDGPGTWI